MHSSISIIHSFHITIGYPVSAPFILFQWNDKIFYIFRQTIGYRPQFNKLMLWSVRANNDNGKIMITQSSDLWTILILCRSIHDKSLQKGAKYNIGSKYTECKHHNWWEYLSIDHSLLPLRKRVIVSVSLQLMQLISCHCQTLLLDASDLEFLLHHFRSISFACDWCKSNLKQKTT